MAIRSRLKGIFTLFAAIVVVTGVEANDEVPIKVILSGAVVDDAGKPVAGAEISADARAKSDPVKSDAQGAFRLSLPLTPQGQIYDTIVARKGDDLLGILFVYGEKKQKEPVTVVLKPARTLDIRVVDGDSHPVVGADVYFLANLQQIVAGRTDAQGRWTEKVPADAKDWGVYALKSKIGFDYALAERARSSKETPFPLPDRLTLTLDGARPPLRIKAVDQNGKPLPGVEIGPWLIQKPGHESQMNGMNAAFLKTDDHGVATIDWLPARAEHGFSILSSSSTHYSPENAAYLPADKPVDEVTIAFLPCEQLSGQVTTADGRPAAGVALTVQGQGAGSKSFHNETTTDSEGRYALKVYSEQAYIITASKDDMAAPYKSGLLVRAGKPVGGVNLVLGPGTRVKGQVTVGKARLPVAETSVQAVIDKGSIPDELKRKNDRVYHEMSMYFWKQTDKDGRFEFLLGPGEYTIRGPARTNSLKLAIPAENPPLEIVRNFTMPRPEFGPFTATIVDADGKPVAGAVVDGAYQSQNGWFTRIKADAQGTIKVQRSLDPLLIFAESPDKSHAAVLQVDAEATQARIVLKPTATASGRLTDPEGKAIAGRPLSFGIRVHRGPTRSSAYSWHFGGTTTTDSAGGFRFAGLVVGETYEIYSTADNNRVPSAKTKITPTDPSLISLGDVPIDLSEPKPYVPPTPAQRTGESFAARKEKSPREKLAYVLDEARREYTRPLLLFGDPKDPACVDLFRLFNEQSEVEKSKPAKPRAKSPGDLRWEFELSSLDAAQPDVKAFAKDLGVSLSDLETPLLAVLSNDGKLSATYPLRLGLDKKLDAHALGAFLLLHKLPTRDAETMLTEGLAKAKAENKRLFLIMSASWCGPCRVLARFLTANKPELERHYVFVKLDVSRDEHARNLLERYEGKDASNGVPWYVILDEAGKPLITSNAKELDEDSVSTNIGFPSSKPGIDHFLGMLRQTAPRLSDESIAALRQMLEKKP